MRLRALGPVRLGTLLSWMLGYVTASSDAARVADGNARTVGTFDLGGKKRDENLHLLFRQHVLDLLSGPR